MDNFSVVIRAKDEERWIGHTIQSVLDCLDRPQIIVVDDHSTDETIQVVRRFRHDPELNDTKRASYTEIQITPIDDYSPGRSLNKGMSLSKRDYLLIISGHCVLKRFDVERVKEQLEIHACVFGKQNPVYMGKRIRRRYLWSHFGDEEVVNMYSEMEQRSFMHNGLAVYQRQTLLDYPFDENLVGKEDRYWANDMVAEGLSILYDPEMEADHHYTERGNTWKGIG